ncbi:MAG: hypothetical protein Q7S89_01285 [bacterium]|nr:hypothetical protein [bacterium]
MNPRVITLIIVGAFLLGLGTVFGFALGRRTAFFATSFPSADDEAITTLSEQDSVKLGTVTSVGDDAIVITLDGGKTVSIKRSNILKVVVMHPLAPDKFALALEAYRSALKRGDQKVEPPSDSVAESLGVSDLKAGMRVEVDGSGEEKSIVVLSQ